MRDRMIASIAAATFITISQVSPLHAYDEIVEKTTFTLPSYVTVGGQTIKDVKIGWESYGTLNADKSNVILITHYFSGTSHAGGRYSGDNSVGYWDAIIGPGKPLDTDKYFILSSDTLVNLNAKDPRVVTTGPASVDPSTNRPYGQTFPIVTIRDFVNVQKALVESLGISKLHSVMGASLGALQAYEWASSYPAMVGKVIPVIGAGETDGWAIAWLHMWAAPILIDPNWSNGDYYGKAEPIAGLSTALALVTLHAAHWEWANSSSPAYGRSWAVPGANPGNCLVACQYEIEATPGARRERRSRTPTISSILSRPASFLLRAAAIWSTASGRSPHRFSSSPATTI